MPPQLHRQPWMDSDIETFRDQVRRYIAAEMAPKLPGWREQGYIPRETWRPFGEMGFLLPEMPETYGGASASLAYQLVVQDELTKAEMPNNVTVHSIASHYIMDFGTEAQKQRWLPKLNNGEMLVGIAMTEPSCGTDLKAIATRARRDGDHYVIDGAKTFITNGFTCNLLIVVARTGEAGGRGLSLIVVETENLPGFRVGRLLEKIGMPASDTAELFFDEVRVPVDQLLGGVEGHGFKQLMSQLPYERMSIAVPAAAVIDRALELTIEYTKERKIFGAPLFDMQTTRHKLAELATIAHVVRTFVNDCTQRLLDGTLDDEVAYMAKWWCTEQQCRVTDECLQLFGGYGFMAEYPIARMYAASRVQKIYGGANEVMKELIARKL